MMRSTIKSYELARLYGSKLYLAIGAKRLGTMCLQLRKESRGAQKRIEKVLRAFCDLAALSGYNDSSWGCSSLSKEMHGTPHMSALMRLCKNGTSESQVKGFLATTCFLHHFFFQLCKMAALSLDCRSQALWNGCVTWACTLQKHTRNPERVELTLCNFLFMFYEWHTSL